jgi:hypothetical protein
MPEKKSEGFTVTDRRLFTSEGEPRTQQESAAEEPKPSPEVKAPSAPAPPPAAVSMEDAPPPPTAAEQQQQADAYKQSASDMDRRAELSGHSPRDLEMTFERFLASMYMTAMLQLGLMRQQGEEPRVDIIAARQTIDTLGLLQEKTKGNLTSSEADFLQNCLYEIRMAYVEVTNALAHPPQAPAAGAGNR